MLSECLDWAVVSIPIVIGFMQWVIPIKKPKTYHKVWLFIGCILFSSLIWLQQHLARGEQSAEFNNLPGRIAGEIMKTLPKDMSRKPATSRWGLTNGQFALLSRRLKPFAPSEEQKTFISCIMGNDGSTRFAAGLASAFTTAGWKISGSEYNQSIVDPVPEGIRFYVHSKDDAMRGIPALDTVLAMLKEAGIENVQGFRRDEVPVGQFQILVGLKPEP